MSKIEEALKRLENCFIQVYIRGGKIVKIPPQEVEMQERAGIHTKHFIHADIVEEKTGE